MTTVGDVMTNDVFTVEPDTSIAEIAKVMVKGRVGSVVVCRGKMIVGIFTERDVLRATAAGDDPASTPVKNWMTNDPVTASPDRGTEDALTDMIGQGFRHLPVVVGTDLVGVVSLRDLLAARLGQP
jgi:CBS domain-containing protein